MAKITNNVRNKMDKPTNAGVSGQILRNDGAGTSYWDNAATQSEINAAVTQWLHDNVPAGQTVVVDQSLSTSGAAADAKKTGDGLSDLNSAFSGVNNDLFKLIGYVQDSWEQGGLYNETGIEYPSSNVIRTPFLKVNPGEMLYINRQNSALLQILEFTSDTTTASGINERTKIKGISQGISSLILDNTTNYIRLLLNVGDIDEGNNVLLCTTNNVVFNRIDEVVKAFPFNDPELIKFIPEYYQNDNTDLSTVTQVRIYNGSGGLYGFKLYNSSLATVVNCTFSSPQNGIVHKDNSYAVFNNINMLGSQYKDFKNVSVNSCVKNMEAMSTIYAYIKDDIIMQNVETIDTMSFRNPFSNPDVNNIIREYYQEENLDLTTVTKIRILNGLSGLYGFNLYDSSNNTILAFRVNGEPNGGVYKSGTAYAVIENIASIGNTYKDYTTTVNNRAKNVCSMPCIYAYIRSTGDYYPFGSHELNRFIPEYYQADNTDLTTVTQVRIYNGQGGLYGFKLFNSSSVAVVDCTFDSLQTGVVHKGNTYAVLENIGSIGAQYKDFKNITVNQCTKHVETMPALYAYIAVNNITPSITTDAVSCVPEKGQIIYEGDTKSNSGYIVNAVVYSDGVIIACRANGKVVRIGYSGTEETLLTINGTAPFDWRGCFIDSNENVYVSPHASLGSMNVLDRGLYRLARGSSSFTKVISLYNTSSDVQTETEDNDDTIWTMCEDDDGNLYAGVYAHLKRPNPSIYKSTDGGLTWTYIYNFRTAGDTATGLHIHSIVWSKWQKALYVIVGENNTIFRSVNGGVSWENLHVTLRTKGSSMLATEFGIFIGSDGAYNCEIDILENDNITHRTVFSGWANTVFAIRRSDITGMLYAFTKIDSSVNSTSYFPPVEALTDPDEIDTWHTSVGDTVYNAWKAYHDSVVDTYPDDAIRPQHFSILVSRDGGTHWEPLKRFVSSSEYANGCWTIGWFMNGECLAGRMVTRQMIKPIIISEGKHKYVSGGCNLDGEIFVRTNTSEVVTII